MAGREPRAGAASSTRSACCKIDTDLRQLASATRQCVASRLPLHLSIEAVRRVIPVVPYGGCALRSASEGEISMKLEFRQRLLTTTLLVGVAALASPAFAQDAAPDTPPPPNAPTDGTTVDTTNPTGPVEAQPTPAQSAEGETVRDAQDIIVTGTRIPQPNLTSAAPVTVVTNQDVKLTGTTRVEDLLNQLPSVGASQASGVSNGATGTAEVDLRYLGSKRTLALV